MQTQTHDHGLVHDLETMLKRSAGRKQVLRWLVAGRASALPLVGWGGGDVADFAASLQVVISA